MKPYRGYLLDADNTLFDWDAAEGEAFAETLAADLPTVPPARARAAYREINREYWARLEKGEIGMAELKEGRFEALLRTLGAPGDPMAVAYGYIARLSTKAYLLPHAREVVEALARRAPLALVTNGISAVQRGRVAASGLAPAFTAILVSEETGIAKPDPRVFAAACAAIGRDPSEVLCVGDSPAADVAGARAAGIAACWFRPRGTPWPGPGNPPDHVAADLRELVDW